MVVAGSQTGVLHLQPGTALTVWVLCFKEHNLKTSQKETKDLEKAQQCRELRIFSRGEQRLRRDINIFLMDKNVF